MPVNNHVSLMGRLGRDPETRHTTNGKMVVNFSLAVDDGYGQDKKTEWFRCVAFGKTGESIGNHVSKGDAIAIHGKGQFNQWETKEGVKRNDFEVVVFQWSYQAGSNSRGVGGGAGHEGGADQAQQQHQEGKANGYQPDGQGQGDFDDDIPF